MKGDVRSSDEHHIKTLISGDFKLRCIPAVKNRLRHSMSGLGQGNLIQIDPRELRPLFQKILAFPAKSTAHAEDPQRTLLGEIFSQPGK
jgi:hypothetical protein